MTMKIKKPDAYRVKVRSRKDIVKFLMDHDDYYRSMATCSPLAWNVKAPGAELNYDHLKEVYRKSGEYAPDDIWLDDPDFNRQARQTYESFKNNLWHWAIEACQENVNSTDSYNHLWNGTDVDVTYEFEGRSGGWIIVTQFEGHKLANLDKQEFEQDMMDKDVWTYDDLFNLYQLVLMLDHDWQREKVEAKIEHQAAFTLFENLCGEIPRPEKTQLTLAFGN